MEQGESWVGFSRPLSSLASQSCFPEAWFSTRPGLLVASVASRPEPRPSLPLSSPAWLWQQPPPYEALSPRGTNVSSQGGQAGWEARGHGAQLPVPPRECPPAHQVVKRSQSMSSGGQVLHKKTDENKPEAASCVRAASAKRQQLLQGWAARPSREGDLGTESRSRGAARGGASTCEGPGQGGGPAGPGGRGGHRARAGQTQAGQASGASWCRTGHWRDT